MYFIQVNVFKKFIVNILKKLGVRNRFIIEHVSSGLIDASLRGIDSHGVRLLFHYIKAVQSGRININPKFRFIKTSMSTGILDADHTFGHVAGIKAMQYAVKLAKKSGTGHVAVKHSTHCGALAYFAHEASHQDMIGVAYTHATARIKTPNGIRPFFGNNPMCFTAPMKNEEPFCYDGANSVITFNEIRRYQQLNQKLPKYVAADKNGILTENPNEAEQLVPIGDYKGFGLSMVVDIFCGLLTGMPTGKNISRMFGNEDIMKEKRNLGQFYSAYKIDSFISPEEFKEKMQYLVDTIRAEPSLDKNKSILAPGDPEKISKRTRLEHGIPVPNEDYIEFNKIAKEFGIKGI